MNPAPAAMLEQVQVPLPDRGGSPLGARMIAIARAAADLHQAREAAWRSEDPTAEFVWPAPALARVGELERRALLDDEELPGAAE